MATRITRTLVDDIDGTDVGVETVEFGYKGIPYEGDFSPANRQKLDKALEPFINAARKKRKRTAGPGTAHIGRTTHSREQSRTMRQWLRDAGQKVPARGRIPQDMQEMFYTANPNDRSLVTS